MKYSRRYEEDFIFQFLLFHFRIGYLELINIWVFVSFHTVNPDKSSMFLNCLESEIGKEEYY